MSLRSKKMVHCLTLLGLSVLWQLASNANNSAIFQIGSNSKNHDTNYSYMHTDFIAGGMPVENDDITAKYMVSLRSRTPIKYFGDNHYCAGTIIGPTTILTAAHCVMDNRKVLTRARRLLIVAGTPQRLELNRMTVQFPVNRIYAHMNFILYNTNDIAVVQIKGRFPDNNPNIAIVPLPTAQPPFGNICFIYGWRRLFDDGPLSDSLLKFMVVLRTVDQCKQDVTRYDENSMLCAFTRNENFEGLACRGDSGGALMCDKLQYGIISWSVKCDKTPSINIFADIFVHIDWITNLTAKLNSGSTASTNTIISVILTAMNMYIHYHIVLSLNLSLSCF